MGVDLAQEIVYGIEEWQPSSAQLTGPYYQECMGRLNWICPNFQRVVGLAKGMNFGEPKTVDLACYIHEREAVEFIPIQKGCFDYFDRQKRKAVDHWQKESTVVGGAERYSNRQPDGCYSPDTTCPHLQDLRSLIGR